MADLELSERAIDPQYLRFVVERLEGFRSHPLGFRVAGTPEERADKRRRLAGESAAPSEEAFVAACEEGRSMTLQQAIDAALEGAEDHP